MVRNRCWVAAYWSFGHAVVLGLGANDGRQAVSRRMRKLGKGRDEKSLGRTGWGLGDPSYARRGNAHRLIRSPVVHGVLVVER